MSGIRDFNWVFRFEQTQIFREVFGHSLIPQRYHNDPSLGSWVCRQRYLFKNVAMNSGRQLLLKQLDFNQRSPKNFFFSPCGIDVILNFVIIKKFMEIVMSPVNFFLINPLDFG